jgi:glycosyltransferase involved in cell wall biosynthesis
MIACVTPLPPSPSGVADYAQDLLTRLRQRREVSVFVEDLRSRDVLPGWPIYSHRDIAKYNFKSILYQLGNNRLHRFAYDAALRRPGVIVLHDALMQHLLLGESWDAWEREFVFTYGERGREIAATLRDGVPGSQPGFFRYPLVKRVVEANRRVIVTNRASEARVRSECPQADVRVIPLPFVRRGKEVAREQARRELGVAADAFLVGCLGYMRESRLLTEVLGVYDALRHRVPRAEFVQVGEFVTPDMERAMAPRLKKLGARRPGRVSDQDFEKWGVACDVVVNLRFPSIGESSGVSVRMMGLGVPVAMTENAEDADFPDDACLKIPHSEIEEALLLEYLLALARKPELGRAIGANAAKYVRGAHDPDRVVDLYLDALEAES